MHRWWPLGGVIVLLIVAAACGSSTAATGPSGPGSRTVDATVKVVASTNVYGDIAAQIAGDRAQITSIIADAAQDPHSYDANPQNLLALSKADIVIENGGGYDDFMDSMRESANNPSAVVLNVVDLSGKVAPAGGELNEHVWYDLPTVDTLADSLTSALSTVDPAGAATFSANAAAFKKGLAALQTTAAGIAAAHRGAGVAITEPVPLYLLAAAGLVNKTPAAFSSAVEEGTDVPIGVMAQTLDLFTAHQVAVLAYNEQTSGAQTDKVLAAAQQNAVPAVPFTETLPVGMDYLRWMAGNLAALQSALSRPADG